MTSGLMLNYYMVSVPFTFVRGVRCIVTELKGESEFGIRGTFVDIGHGTPAESTGVVVIREVVGAVKRTLYRCCWF